MAKHYGQDNNPQVFKPEKRLGQHFLRRKWVLNRVIKAACLKKTDLVVEIGPGTGVLTRELAKKASKVIAIEKDWRLIPVLKDKFKDAKNVEIVQGDARKLVSSIYKIQDTKYKVVANLPYYAATHIIRQFLESNYPPQLMVVMVQKEVAKRICVYPPKPWQRRAKPEMNLLATCIQFYAEPKIITYVPKTAFWPKPKIESAILKLKTKNYKLKTNIDAGMFFKIVKTGFSHPRKQIINNLSHGLKLSRAETESWLSRANISPSQRPQSLTLNNWLALTKEFMVQWKNIKTLENK